MKEKPLSLVLKLWALWRWEARHNQRSFPGWEKWRPFLLSSPGILSALTFVPFYKPRLVFSSWRENSLEGVLSLLSNFFILQLSVKCLIHHPSETDSAWELDRWIITMLPDHWEPWWVPGNHRWSFLFRGEVRLFLSHPVLSWFDAKRCNPLTRPPISFLSTHSMVI